MRLLPCVELLVQQSAEDAPPVEGGEVDLNVARTERNFALEAETVVSVAKLPEPPIGEPFDTNGDVRDLQFKLDVEVIPPGVQVLEYVLEGPLLSDLMMSELFVDFRHFGAPLEMMLSWGRAKTTSGTGVGYCLHHAGAISGAPRKGTGNVPAK